jgi:hypothetical protein
MGEMMKIKRIVRYFVLCLSVVSLFCTPTHAIGIENLANTSEEIPDIEDYAIRDNVICITMSEYDIYVRGLQQEKAALRKAGYSSKEIDASRTYEAENKVLALGSLSEDKLSDMGYNKDQIELLKTYNGKPLEEAPQMASALATMSVTITAGSCTTQNITAHLNWEWDSAPALYAYNDSVAVSFEAYNSDSQKIGVTYNSGYTHSYVTYRNYLTNDHIKTTSTALTSKNTYHGVGTTFPRLDDTLTGYAKSGSFNCYVNLPSTTTASINYATFEFEYVCPKTSDIAFHKRVTISSTGALTVNY